MLKSPPKISEWIIDLITSSPGRSGRARPPFLKVVVFNLHYSYRFHNIRRPMLNLPHIIEKANIRRRTVCRLIVVMSHFIALTLRYVSDARRVFHRFLRLIQLSLHHIPDKCFLLLFQLVEHLLIVFVLLAFALGIRVQFLFFAAFIFFLIVHQVLAGIELRPFAIEYVLLVHEIIMYNYTLSI